MADIPDLAAGHQVIQGGQGLLDGGARVRGVELVEVDPLSIQAAKGRLYGLDDIAARAPGVKVVAVDSVHIHTELGADDHVIAAPLQRFAQHGFAEARLTPVHVGNVEESHPGV
ncbi:hypothetical protein D3C73_1302340 [compost metagenome]